MACSLGRIFLKRVLQVIVSVNIPFLSAATIFSSYKIMPRAEVSVQSIPMRGFFLLQTLLLLFLLMLFLFFVVVVVFL